MAFKPAAIILHASSLAYMLYGYNGLGNLTIDEWIRGQKGGHFQFLTIQGLVIAELMMAMGLVLDLFPSLTMLRTIKRTIFMASMPVAVVVTSFYWVLLFIRPALILLPEPHQPIKDSPAVMLALAKIPLSMDLALHITPTLALFLDFFYFEKKYSKRTASYGAPLVVALFAVWYSWWVEYVARHNGVFPYPFLETTIENRIAIYILAVVVALFSFWAINAVHPERRTSKSKRRK